MIDIVFPGKRVSRRATAANSYCADTSVPTFWVDILALCDIPGTVAGKRDAGFTYSFGLGWLLRTQSFPPPFPFHPSLFFADP